MSAPVSPYGSLVLEHFRRPRNRRSLDRPVAASEAYNPLCGDRVRLELDVADGRIADAAFTSNACALCTASASLLTSRVRGLSADEALVIGDDQLVAALETDVPPARRPCVLLPARALREAIARLDAGA